MRFYLIIIAVLSLVAPGCSKNEGFRETDVVVKGVQYRLLIENLSNYGIFTTSSRNVEKPTTLQWLKVEKEKSDQPELYHIETRQGKRLHTKTWFGPGNIRLLRTEDINKDGKMDMVRYFNQNELTGKKNTTARMDIDVDGDGRPEAWIFPAARMEFDTNGDNLPDHISTQDNQRVTNFLDLSFTMDISKLKGGKLKTQDSWVLHPEQILNHQRYTPLVQYATEQWLHRQAASP